VLKPIKLLEGIGNGALRSTTILWTNGQHFILLRSIRVYEKPWGWPPADLYFVPMPVCAALTPNANVGLSDWSLRSTG